MSTNRIFRTTAADEWTLERIGRLTVQDIKQLQENAERLNEQAVAELCRQALKARPQPKVVARSKSASRTRATRLIARSRAFQSRGVHLADPRTSWSGQRKSDGVVVFALWADHVRSARGECSYLLWAPNVERARPWSDTPAGEERLEHCRCALQQGGRAEGLLVYGEAVEGHIPEERAHQIRGADAEIVLSFQVQLRGAEYWAVWGKLAA
jgi:hypothetical protein